MATQGGEPSDSLKSEQMKWTGESVGGHETIGLPGLEVKSAKKGRSQDIRGRGRGRGRVRAGSKATRMQALKKQGEGGLAGKGKGKAKVVSEPAAHEQKLDEEGTVDGGSIVSGPDRPTTIPGVFLYDIGF